MKSEAALRPRFNLDIALAALTAAGITAGVFLSLGMDDSMLSELCGVAGKLSLAASGGGAKIFFGSFCGVGAILVAAFFCGFCAVAQPIELFLAAFRGLGLGICVRGIYFEENIFAAMAAFLPFAVLSTGVLILSEREAFRLSMRYFALSSTDENRLGIKNEIHDYTARFLIYALLLAILSALDSLIAGALV